jgi:predicted small lipoprotein YifL
MLAALLLVLPLAACGKRGPLELPPEAKTLKDAEGKPITATELQKNRPFILDPLLK